MTAHCFLRSSPRLPAFFTALLVTVAAFCASANGQTTIMPMGDSITVGVDYLTVSSGGYRDPLYRDLKAAGITSTFVGVNSSLPTTILSNSGNAMHNGFGGWHIQDLNNNLNGVADPIGGGDSNQGGYLLTGGHGTGRSAVTPSIVLLEIGTNDILQGNANINEDLYSLVTNFHALSPNSKILIAGITPINSSGFATRINAYNTYIQTQLVPSLSYTRYVDQNSSFLNADGSVNGGLLGDDLIHPDRFGYPIIGNKWAIALESLLGVSPKTYPLVVNGGFGSGSLPAGTVTTVGAAAPGTNSQFGSWMPATTALSNPNNALSVLTMPSAATTLTANYTAAGSPLVANGTYQIGSGYDGLSIGAIQASSASGVQQQTYTGIASQQWNLVNLGSNTVSLELPGTVLALGVPAGSASTLSANLDVEPYQGGSNQKWQLVPTMGYLQLVNVGSQLAVNISGYSTSPGAALDQYTLACTNNLWSFYPVGSAQPTYALTITNGSGGGTYAAGTLVSIVANPAPGGYQFTGWTGSINGVANIASASTVLTMPASSAAITANYGPVPTLPTLSVTSGSGSGTYAAGTVVTITANAPASGQKFASWTGATSTVASTSTATTTITVPAAGAAVTATYTAAAAAVTSSTGNNTVSIQFVGGGAAPLHGRGFDYTAGAGSHSVGNWNPVVVSGNTTKPQSVNVSSGLTDSTGAASSIGFQLTSSGAYYTGAGTGFTTSPPYPGYPGRTSGAGDEFLYAGFAYAGYSDNNPVTLILSGLQATHSYSILAYVTPFEQFGNSQQATVALSGNASYAMYTDGKAGTYEHVTSSATSGNYVEFDNVTGAAAQTLTLTNRGSLIGLSGIQIVDNGASTGTTSGSSSGTSGSTSSTSGSSSSTSSSSGSVSSITGVQFVGGGAAPLRSASWNYTAGAGTYAASNWNSVLAIGNTTVPQKLTVASGLIDWAGAPSSIGFILNASGAYYTGSGTGFPTDPYPGYGGKTSGAGDAFLYAGFAYAGYSNNLPETLTITGLSSTHKYSLLVYVAPFIGLGDAQLASVALTGGPTYYLQAKGRLSSYQLSSATSATTAVGANYVEFDNLTGASAETLTFTNSGTLAGVNGFQVIDLGVR